ncbi:MAG: hypothetical protein COB94_002165 [Gammaproteobacteria bacterium]|nr:hypothetical protein [Gammaproteobacteria bacterium]
MYALNQLFGVRLELFSDLTSYFHPTLFIGLVFTPFIAGVIVSLIYGLGGKVLCYFPALMVYLFQYLGTFAGYTPVPDDVRLLPIGYMGFIIIVAIEAAAVGGILGELWVKKTYGRMPRHIAYTDDKDKPKLGH